MESDDLMAAVFPTLAACQENVAPGPMDIPDHPLVRQTLDDCLREAMDVDGLRELLAEIEAGGGGGGDPASRGAGAPGPRSPHRQPLPLPSAAPPPGRGSRAGPTPPGLAGGGREPA